MYMPIKGPDKNKLCKIRNVLRQNPQGLWIREIARRTKISKSTVHIYVNNYMKDELRDIIDVRGSLLRLIKLRK